jgi:hypothetical protein
MVVILGKHVALCLYWKYVINKKILEGVARWFGTADHPPPRTEPCQIKPAMTEQESGNVVSRHMLIWNNNKKDIEHEGTRIISDLFVLLSVQQHETWTSTVTHMLI